MSKRLARELARQRDERAHRVLDMCESLDLRNASDKEMERILDGMACVAGKQLAGGAALSLDCALDELEAVAARVARRRRPWKSRKRWRADVRTVTHEGRSVAHPQPAERLRKDLGAIRAEPAAPADNVLPFAPRTRGGRFTGREWTSQRTRGGQSITRGIEDQTF